MDFQPKIKYNLPTGIPIPFFMAYPGYLTMLPKEEQPVRDMRRDFEYLRQTYPAQVRKYQRRVEEVLDRVDYEGSMIYDEYPDRLSIQCLGNTVVKTLENEEENNAGKLRSETLQELIEVLVCNEIYRRRHGSRKYD